MTLRELNASRARCHWLDGRRLKHRLFSLENIATGRALPGSLPKHTGNMAAVVAPSAILTTRVVAPKARAARTLKATAFKGAKLAQPKVSDPRLSSGVISFRDI